MKELPNKDESQKSIDRIAEIMDRARFPAVRPLPGSRQVRNPNAPEPLLTSKEVERLLDLMERGAKLREKSVTPDFKIDWVIADQTIEDCVFKNPIKPVVRRSSIPEVDVQSSPAPKNNKDNS